MSLLDYVIVANAGGAGLFGGLFIGIVMGLEIVKGYHKNDKPPKD